MKEKNIVKEEKIESKIKTNFRLYTDTLADFKSTIFDLISGEKETKQTKGLAYIFSQYNEFLFAFLKFESVKKSISKKLHKNIDFNKISLIEVSAEKLTIDKKRADIVIKIDSERRPLIAIVIEAKSIKANVNQQDIENQMLTYLNESQFTELINYEKIGVVLTKYKQNIPHLINITWDNVVQILMDVCKEKNDNEIITQYLKFLTQIDKAMKYYEKEVLSIPAGKSFTDIDNFNIYVCPNSKKYNYKRSLFVTFREKGSVMKKLYKIDDIIILNTSNQSEIESLRNSTYSENTKRRILEYIDATKHSQDFDEKFYILSETDSIELQNKPKSAKPPQGPVYYTLKEILTETIVVPESQQLNNP